jgi:hypothetical protein
MDADDSRAKWHSVDENAANVLIMGSSTPGVVYPVSTSALPSQIQQMQGVVSYFVSNYVTSVVLANNATAGGEMAVVRTDGTIGRMLRRALCDDEY